MKKRILALMLAILAVCTVLASCASSEPYDFDSFDQFITLPEDPASVISVNESQIQDSIMNAYFALFSNSDSDTKYKKVEISEGEIRVGDTVTINYVGTIDGVAFEGGTANAQELTIGSGSYIEGFEDGLKGFTKGDKVVLILKFPDPYTNNPDLAGKPVRFEVTITKIQRTNYPDYTEENVKAHSTYTDIASFETAKRAEAIRNLAWSDYASACTVKKYPEDELRYYYDNIISNYEDTAMLMGGYTLDAYASMMGYSDMPSFYKYVLSQAKAQVKQELIILASAEKFGLTLKGSELEKKFQELYKEHSSTGHDHGYKDFVEEYGGERYLEIEVYYDLVIDYLAENKASVKDNTIKEGFVSGKGGLCFYKNNIAQTGWIEYDYNGDGTNEYYYFDPETGYAFESIAALVPTREDASVLKYQFFGQNGKFVRICGADGKAEIVSDGNGLLYVVDGAKQTGLKEFDRHADIPGDEKYWFDPADNGHLATGLKKLDATFGENADKYYDFGTTGIYDPEKTISALPTLDTANGFISDGIHTEQVDDTTSQYKLYIGSKLVTGKNTYGEGENAKTYISDENGIIQVNKLVDYNGSTYLAGPDGALLKGLVSFDEKTYYADDNFVILKNGSVDVDGKTYTFDENGVLKTTEPA